MCLFSSLVFSSTTRVLLWYINFEKKHCSISLSRAHCAFFKRRRCASLSICMAYKIFVACLVTFIIRLVCVRRGSCRTAPSFFTCERASRQKWVTLTKREQPKAPNDTAGITCAQLWMQMPHRDKIIAPRDTLNFAKRPPLMTHLNFIHIIIWESQFILFASNCLNSVGNCFPCLPPWILI